MCKLLEIIETNFKALKQIAHDIAFMDNISDYDKCRLNNAIKGCYLILIILEDGAPELYPKLKKEFDVTVMEIKDKINSSEYEFKGNLSFPE